MSYTLLKDLPGSVSLHLTDTNGVAVVGLLYTDVDVSILKAGDTAFSAVTLSSSNFQEVGSGNYIVTLSALDTDAAGLLYIKATGSTISTTTVSVYVASTVSPAPNTVTSPTVSTLYGYLKDSDGSPVLGAAVSAELISSPYIQNSTGDGVLLARSVVKASTDANGYFSFLFMPGCLVRLTIGTANYQRVLTVPSWDANIFDLEDPGTTATGGVLPANTTIVHAQLAGLNADDHTHYILVDGSRAFTGNIDAGGNSIINVNLVDGRSVASDGVSLDNNTADIATLQTDLTTHTADTGNPHAVTATQVGLGTAAADIATLQTDLSAHTADTGNPHSVTASQVGLGTVAVDVSALQAVANTAAEKAALGAASSLSALNPVASASDLTAVANAAIPITQKAAALGVATLDASSKVPLAQLPAIAITETFVVGSEVAMLALSAETGDVCARSDLSKTYILAADPASTLSNWQELLTPTGLVAQTRQVGTNAPLTGGGSLAGDLTISISAASGIADGSMSAADKTKLDTFQAESAYPRLDSSRQFTGNLRSTAQAVTYAATKTLDLSASNDFVIAALTGDIAVSFSNDADDRQGLIYVVQDGTGGHLLTFTAPGTRTLLRDQGSGSLDAASAASAQTVYAYSCYSRGGTGYMLITKSAVVPA